MKAFNGLDIDRFLGLETGAVTEKGKRSAEKKAAQELSQEIQPFIVGIDHKGGNGQCINSVKEPLMTITTKARHALVNAFVVGAGGPERAGVPRSVDRPLNTVLTRQSMALVEPRIVEGQAFMVSAGGPEGKGRKPRSVSDPLPTVLTENHSALVRPFIVTVNHGDSARGTKTDARCHEIDRPLPTVTTHNGYGIVQAFLTKYYGTGTVQSINEPLDTVTTRERFALVEPRITRISRKPSRQGPRLVPLIPLGNDLYLDLRFRMLKSHELAGNAVPHFTAKALCKERLKRYSRPSRLPLHRTTSTTPSMHASEHPN
jgi:DNA (cytosine-5)-methyltransferase 1